MYSLLYVDDEPGLLEIARTFLEKSGEFSVDVHTSAQDALATDKFSSYDAIISDYQMPEMDGIAFLKEVRFRFGTIPFILFTGRGREEVVIEAINNGADFYLQKGGDPRAQFAELMHKIRQAITRRQAQNELKAAYERITASEEELRSQLDEIIKAQQDREKTEKNFRNLVDNAPDAIYIQTNNRFVYLNNAALRLLGATSAGQLLGKNTFDCIHPSFHECIRERVKRLTIDIKPVELLDEVYLKLNGTPVDVEVTAVPFQYEGEHGALVIVRDVTIRKRAEAELRAAYEQISAAEEELRGQYEELAQSEQKVRESEEKFRELAELLPQTVFEMDLDLRITFANRFALATFGLAREDIDKGIFALSYIDPAHHERVRNNFKAIAGGEPAEIQEYTLSKKDGSIFTVLLYAAPVFRAGRLEGFRGILIDISDRKRAEDALRESEEKYRMLVEVNQDIIYSLDLDGTILYMSPQTSDQLGYRPDEMEGKNFEWFIHPDDVGMLVSHIGEPFKAGHLGPSDQFRVRRNDGTYRWYEDKSIYTVDRSGRKIIVGTIRDITEQKNARDELLSAYEQLTAADEELRGQYDELALTSERLRESEEKYRMLVETTSDFIWEVDAAAVYTYVSPKVREMLGYEPEEMVGKTPFDFMPPDEARRVAADFNRCVESRIPIITLENKNLRKDGSVVILETSGIPRYTEDGMFAGYRGIDRDVSDRKSTEEALRASEETFRRVIEGAPEAIYIGVDWKFVYLNPAAVRLFGASSSEQLGGTPFMNLIHPRFHDKIRSRVHQLYDERAPVPLLEEVYIRLDGTEIDVEVSSVPFRFAGNDGALVFIRDITDRKKAEKGLKESEDRYRRLISHSFDAVIIHQEGRIVLANDAALRIIGAAPDADLIGTPIFSFVHPDFRGLVAKRVEEMLTPPGRTVPLVEEKFIRLDGTFVDVEVMESATQHEGKPAVMVVFRDITDRKVAESALRESELRYRSIIEGIEDGFVRTDNDGRITMASPSVAHMMGYDSAEEIIGRPIISFYRMGENRQALMDQMGKEKNVRDYEMEFIRKDGTVFWASLSAKFRYGENNEILGTEAVIRDISERKRMENAIRDINRKLSLLNRVTTHDVANQLTVLRGYIQLAGMKSPDSDMTNLLTKIDTAAEVIARQIEFTRAYQDLGAREPVWQDVGKILAHCHQPAIHLSAAEVSGVEILADPMLHMVFSNLMDNTVRHGKRTTRVTVRASEDGKGLTVFWEDNGIGIPYEEKEKIFEQGFGKNTGFGLFIVREILSLTGITIRETGEPGSGARFEMMVPKSSYRIGASL
ncbi:MAG: Bacterioopsin transcriptional activator [Methanoregula sp. PtaU1.Bin051]|nr:MAG: Bacterioopsin transcriptional activator [Methanoregula sp. PtaU1.Bin051]